MTRDNLKSFNALVAAADEIITDVGIEIEVDGEDVEICDFPAVAEQDERDDWLEFDWTAINQFPEIADELERTLDAYSRHAADDAAVRRAESGYAQ